MAPAPTLAGVDREPEDINKQRELFQQIQKRAQAIPAKPSFTPMDRAAHKAAHELQQRLWPRNGWPKDLSVEERTAFSHKIYRIKQEELGVLVAKLDAMCPDAIDKHASHDEIDVNIDKIDVRTFRELDRYTADWHRAQDDDAAERTGVEQASPAVDEPQPPAEDPWAPLTTADGHVYWYHTETHETTWERPVPVAAPTPAPQPVPTAPAPVAPALP